MKRLLLCLPALGLVFVGFSAGCHKEIRYQPPPPVTGENVTDLKDAWVELYTETGFRGRTFTVKYPKIEPNFGSILSDDGSGDFSNQAKSVKWQAPVGWQAVLYDDDGFRGEKFPLIGTGKVESNPDLGRFSGKSQSLRWERKP